MKRKVATITDELEDLVDHVHGKSLKLEDILHRLRERGFGMLMMVLVLPNCVPIPVPPGVSTIFSLPLLFLAAQMVIGKREPWIPQRLATREIGLAYLRAIVGRIAPRLRRIEQWVKPRLAFLSSKAGERLVGICWLLFAISIAVPLPGTNFLPGVGILVSAFGLLNRDGWVMTAGLGIGAGGIVVTTAILFVGGSLINGLF